MSRHGFSLISDWSFTALQRLAVEILRIRGELLKQSFSFFEDLTGWPREKSLYLLYALVQEHKQPPKARGIPYKLPLIISPTGLINLC